MLEKSGVSRNLVQASILKQVSKEEHKSASKYFIKWLTSRILEAMRRLLNSARRLDYDVKERSWGHSSVKCARRSRVAFKYLYTVLTTRERKLASQSRRPFPLSGGGLRNSKFCNGNDLWQFSQQCRLIFKWAYHIAIRFVPPYRSWSALKSRRVIFPYLFKSLALKAYLSYTRNP